MKHEFSRNSPLVRLAFAVVALSVTCLSSSLLLTTPKSPTRNTAAW